MKIPLMFMMDMQSHPSSFSHKNESKLKKIICWVIRSKNFFQMTLLYLCHISNWCYTWNKKAISRNTIILAFLENSSDARKNVQFYVLGEYMFNKERTITDSIVKITTQQSVMHSVTRTKLLYKCMLIDLSS